MISIHETLFTFVLISLKQTGSLLLLLVTVRLLQQLIHSYKTLLAAAMRFGTLQIINIFILKI